jgi:hypothetical protein
MPFFLFAPQKSVGDVITYDNGNEPSDKAPSLSSIVQQPLPNRLEVNRFCSEGFDAGFVIRQNQAFGQSERKIVCFFEKLHSWRCSFIYSELKRVKNLALCQKTIALSVQRDA